MTKIPPHRVQNLYSERELTIKLLLGKKTEKKTNISPFPATHTYIKLTLVSFFFNYFFLHLSLIIFMGYQHKNMGIDISFCSLFQTFPRNYLEPWFTSKTFWPSEMAISDIKNIPELECEIVSKYAWHPKYPVHLKMFDKYLGRQPVVGSRLSLACRTPHRYADMPTWCFPSTVQKYKNRK